jgi:hypothetical protein
MSGDAKEIDSKGLGDKVADNMEAEDWKARGGIPNQKYCKRLIELAFPPSRKYAAPPTTVQVQGQAYSREGLHAALEADPKMELDLRRRYRHVPDPADLKELLDVAFSPTFLLGDEEYTRDGLRSKLHADRVLAEELKKRYRHDGKDWKHVKIEELLDIAFMP